MSWDQAPNDYNKASRDVAESFLEPGTNFLPVGRERSLEEALDPPWAVYLAELVEPDAEGILREAIEDCLGVVSGMEVASLVLEDSSRNGMPKALGIVE